MGLNSLTSVCQAIVKSVISPVLVFIGYNSLGAVSGYTISFLAAGLIGLILFYLTIYKELKSKNQPKSSLSETLGKMLRYGVPLSISSNITGFLVQFYAFIMAIYCDDALIGNFQSSLTIRNNTDVLHISNINSPVPNLLKD